MYSSIPLTHPQDSVTQLYNCTYLPQARDRLCAFSSERLLLRFREAGQPYSELDSEFHRTVPCNQVDRPMQRYAFVSCTYLTLAAVLIALTSVSGEVKGTGILLLELP
jgi:hypothetical protein